jgi:hypothetical protein
MSGRVSLLAATAVSALGLLGCGQAPAAPSPKSASSLPHRQSSACRAGVPRPARQGRIGRTVRRHRYEERRNDI